MKQLYKNLTLITGLLLGTLSMNPVQAMETNTETFSLEFAARSIQVTLPKNIIDGFTQLNQSNQEIAQFVKTTAFNGISSILENINTQFPLKSGDTYPFQLSLNQQKLQLIVGASMAFEDIVSELDPDIKMNLILMVSELLSQPIDGTLKIN